jgi:hypothetical protein
MGKKSTPILNFYQNYAIIGAGCKIGYFAPAFVVSQAKALRNYVFKGCNFKI